MIRLSSRWYLSSHRPRISRPVESWQAYRYWRKFGRISARDRAAIAQWRAIQSAAAAASSGGDQS